MADDNQTQVIDLREVGATGLRRFSGFIFEEFLQELTGWKGAAVYKEMSLNDGTTRACLNAIEMLCRRVKWRAEPASSQPYDIEAAEFLDSCLDDMSTSWLDTVIEILSFLRYGYDVHEIVYKRRAGESDDPTMRSKHSDGRIGWRKFSIRSQDTIYRWEFDDHGGIQGVEQLAPPHYYHVSIPIEKFLLFRTTTERNNPEGLSILRGAYRSWYMLKNIQNIEAVGIERDLAGLPIAYVPAELLSSSADPVQKASLAAIKQVVVNVRRDEQEGIVFPQAYDNNGKPLYEFKLLSSGGSRQFDVNKTISRYKQEIATTMLADFILLGHENVGSFAMTSEKVNLFTTAIGSFLDIIADVFNRYAIPRLFALNDFRVSDYPKLAHGSVGSVDIKELGMYISQLAGSGFPLFPNEELERYLMEVAECPPPLKMEADLDMQVDPKQPIAPKKVVEIPGNPIQTPTGLERTADTTPVNGAPPAPKVTTNVNGSMEPNSNRTNPQAFNQTGFDK